MFTRLYLRLLADHRNAGGTRSRVILNPKAGLMIQGVPVRFSEQQETPAVDGLLRPSISLPSGINRLLSEKELDAVLVHELRHAKRRDNLIRLIFEVGRCVLWFHPLIWVAGSRLALYRELSCDESVIQSARGEELISALAKLAGPEKSVLLQATASSLVRHRISHLAANQEPASATVGGLLAAAFCVVLLAGIFETVAHTACCFMDGH
jgi:beta-lactamase regulating signal transducer with metallopeptidase domain